MVAKWKTASHRVIVAEKGEQTGGRQKFGTRQAAQFGAIDLADEQQRLLLDGRPLPIGRRKRHAAEMRRRRRNHRASLRPQTDGGQHQIHKPIAEFGHSSVQPAGDFISRQRRWWGIAALPNYLPPQAMARRCFLRRFRLRSIEPSKTTAGPLAHFCVRIIRQPLQNRTRLSPSLEFLHDLPAPVREPVLSSNMLGCLCGLDTFDISLRKLCCAQFRKPAAFFPWL